MSRYEAFVLMGIIENFFFGLVVIGAGFAAKPPDVIQRLIAIPACAFRFQGGNASCLSGFCRSGGFNAVVNVLCLIHDSTPEVVIPGRARARKAMTKV